MPAAPPRLPLVLLLLTAVCIFGGGVVLSRREEMVRLRRDRMPLQQFASDLMRELRRLEELHASHLDRLSRTVEANNSVRTQRDCEAVAGVVECSFLSTGPGRTEHYVRMSPVRYGQHPRPTFNPPSLNRADFAALDPARFFEKAESSSGWVDEPGKPLFFWRLRSDMLVVLLTIEPREVVAAMTGWTSQWLKQHPASGFGPDDELTASDGTTFPTGAMLRAGREPPHWSQPLPTRYGTWQISSWDVMEKRISHHMPTLILSSALSVLVALLGVFVFVQQRRAHRLSAQRVSFVNRVSHELRTPLTNMLLNLDVVSDSMPQDGAESVSRLALVREEAGRLARLIENVLTFSRREQGTLKLHVTECRPCEVVEAILTQFTPAFARRGIAVTREHEGADAPCLLDADALSQIAANLLSNVEKYAPGAPATVRTVRRGGTFSLTVSDAGPGIPAAERGRIFEPFTRVDDRVSAGVTGTGLGLSIARELAQRMGGTLTLVESGPGAMFELSVPLMNKVAANDP